jgi:hypothetical protein
VRRAPRVTLLTAGAVPVLLAGFGLHILTDTVLIVLILVVAVCWTITDPGRARRLAMLIKALRGDNRQ